MPTKIHFGLCSKSITKGIVLHCLVRLGGLRFLQKGNLRYYIWSAIRKWEKTMLQRWAIQFKYAMYMPRTWHPLGFHCRECIGALNGRHNDMWDLPTQAHILHYCLDKRTLTKQRCGMVLRIKILRVFSILDSKQGVRGYRILYIPTAVGGLHNTLKPVVSTTFIN